MIPSASRVNTQLVNYFTHFEKAWNLVNRDGLGIGADETRFRFASCCINTTVKVLELLLPQPVRAALRKSSVFRFLGQVYDLFKNFARNRCFVSCSFADTATYR
jgi:hypothetical protein